MLSYDEYPMGDGQTWLGCSVVPTTADIQALEDYLGNAELAAKCADGGVRVVTDNGFPGPPLAEPRYLIDTISGLPYHMSGGGLELNRRRMYSAQHNVIDTCYFRDRLRGTAPGQDGFVLTTSMTGGAIDRYKGLDADAGANCLDSPIVDFEARSRSELVSIIEGVKQELSKGPYFRRLWLRGQREEYKLTRDGSVCAFLGFGATGEIQPSLLPSLGRYARDSANEIDYGWVMVGPNHWWKKPYLVWVIRCNPQWLDHYPEFTKRVENALRSDDDTEFAQILSDIQFDEKVPTEVDDLRQWFFAFFKYSSWIFVLQQYGYYSSMLDITTDLDVALYFSQSKMQDGAMTKVDPADGRVIYIFAESKNQANYFSATEVAWGDEDWTNGLPPRVEKQVAGAIFGSSASAQNLYGHYVVARVFLHGSDCVSSISTSDLFPTEESDLLLRTLRDSRPVPERLY